MTKRPAPEIQWNTGAELGDCFRVIERRKLKRMLVGAACASASCDDEEYAQHCRAVNNALLAVARARCVITQEEGLAEGRAWLRAVAEMWLYMLPPEERREALLDPDGRQRFLTLKRRTQMLREIDAGPRRMRRQLL